MPEWLVHIPIVLYLLGWLAELIQHARDSSRFAWPGGLLAAGWGAHTLLLAVDLVQFQLSLPNLLSLAAWLSMGIYYLARRRGGQGVFRFVFPPFAAALMLTAAFAAERLLLPAGRLDLVPGFHKNLLMVHIITLLGGHLLFATACLISFLYLVQERRLKAKSGLLTGSRLPSLGKLEDLNHRAITLGFLLLSAGILLGLLVAGVHNLPARLLTWRLIIPSLTWLIYAIFLLEYHYQGRRGRFGAMWSIIGFLIAATSSIFEFLVLWLGR
jgi:ABC-type uncharacterized transport system permease subunit